MTGRHDSGDPRAHPSSDPLRARLRDADPATSLPPVDRDRVARLLEATMDRVTTDPPETRAAGARGRSPLTWLVAAAAVVLIAGVGLFALLGTGEDDPEPPVAREPAGQAEPTVTVLAAPSAQDRAARCMVPTAEVLAGQSLAFAGTVTEVGEEVVVLDPDRFYAGEATDLVEVQAPAQELSALVGAVEFREGEDYLLSATDGRVTVCGFSGPATDRLRALYEEAFPG